MSVCGWGLVCVCVYFILYISWEVEPRYSSRLFNSVSGYPSKPYVKFRNRVSHGSDKTRLKSKTIEGIGTEVVIKSPN